MAGGPVVRFGRVRSALFFTAMAILALGIGIAMVQTGAVEALNGSGILRK